MIPKTTEKIVSITDQTVTVRELRAVDGLEFIKHLSKHAGQLMGMAQLGVTNEALAEVIVGAADLSAFLVLKSTQGAVDPAKVNLDDFLEVLKAALEINISDVTLKKAVAVADVVKTRLGLKTLSETSPSPSTT